MESSFGSPHSRRRVLSSAHSSRKSHSAHSEREDHHESSDGHEYNDQQLEQEYKNTEAMRRAYNKENEATIKRQKEVVDKLKAENKELANELELENKLSKKFSSSKTQKSRLVEQLHNYQHKVQEEQSKVDEMKKSIELIQGQIKELEKQTGGAHGAVNNYRTLNKRIRILENRLNKALVKFNTTLSKNNDKRKDIDDLRQERVIFERTYE